MGSWEASALEALALVIVLDQFPRNIHRGSHLAFANDAEARAVARRAIARGFDVALPRTRHFFFYLPFEHSEGAADQDRSVALFGRWAEKHLAYILRHQEIVRRFGRFPHRNAALGRVSTPEEEAFLMEPNSSF